MQYHNNSASQYLYYYSSGDSTLIPYKYKYIHEFFSISSSLNYLFGKNQKWQTGIVLKLGWLIGYYEKVQCAADNVPDYLNTTTSLSNYPAGWIGVRIGRKIIESKKFILMMDFQINYSSQIGTEIVQVENYTPGGIDQISMYVSKPHRLFVPELKFNLQYKL